ncbi:MAG: hypothetical protein WCL60_00500 [Methylococcales bacterium]
MAKVTGPLFSNTASGNLANGNLQYRSGHWGTQVYKPLTPSKQNQGKPSPAQTAQRARFKVVRDGWHALSPDTKQNYNNQAAALGTMNGWNLYVSLGLKNPKQPTDNLLTSDNQQFVDDDNNPLQID